MMVDEYKNDPPSWEFNGQLHDDIDDDANSGKGFAATYTVVHLLHRRLQSVCSVPGLPAILALPVTDLANGIGHVLKDFGELFRA